MGVAYERYLLPKGSVFSPSAAAVAKLVDRLRKDQWIADPASPDFARLRYREGRARLAAKTGAYALVTVENTFGGDVRARLAATMAPAPVSLSAAWLDEPAREELRVVWPVDEEPPAPLKYPLTRKPEGAITYALELHRAHDYVYPGRDAFEPIPTMCLCGEDLGFHWDEDEVVPAFDASSGIFAECEACSRTFDPAKGAAVLTNPFDGTKHEARGGAAYRFALKVDCGKCFVRDAELAFAPELVAVVEDEFGREFCELGAVY